MHAIYQDIQLSTNSAPDLSQLRDFLDRHMAPEDHEFLLSIHQTPGSLSLFWHEKIPDRWAGAKFARLVPDQKIRLQCRLDGKFLRSGH